MPVIGQLAATLISEIGVSVTEFSPDADSRAFRKCSGVSHENVVCAISQKWRIRHPSAINHEIPPNDMRSYNPPVQLGAMSTKRL
jgi:hypothetical protein